MTLIDHPIPVIKSEQKLLFVPAVLRIWDIIGNIIFIYYNHPESSHYIWLQILMVSYGCSDGTVCMCIMQILRYSTFIYQFTCICIIVMSWSLICAFNVL